MNECCDSNEKTSYKAYYARLLAQLAAVIHRTAPFNGGELDELQGALLQKLDTLVEGRADDAMVDGQWLLQRIVADYQHLMPLVPRDLFWYFGGDCLHFLTDEEIAFFQSVEEAYHDSLTAPDSNADYATLIAAAHAPNAEGKIH